ncbi:ilvB operon leader peptide IvbL [Klebsiella pneumoniae]|nr:ilvB operon leader peptide IvbL [Klebsiella pneumoniae]
MNATLIASTLLKTAPAAVVVVSAATTCNQC